MTLFASVNRAANAVFEPWFSLLGPLPAVAQVCITALPVTLFALLVFRFASDQAGITHAKDQIKAHLLELWLYKDDPRVLLRAQGQVVLQSLAYLGYSLVPMAVMIAPLALVVVQLETRFAFRALGPGESAIVTVSTTDPALLAAEPALALPPALVAETPALRVADRAQLLWRLRADQPGAHRAGLVVGAARAGLRIVAAGEGAPRVSPVAYRENDWRVLGYPAEPPLPADSPFSAIEVGYPRARGEFLGLSSATWLLLGATLAFGFALRGALGVTF
jgi:hypothetical protein